MWANASASLIFSSFFRRSSLLRTKTTSTRENMIIIISKPKGWSAVKLSLIAYKTTRGPWSAPQVRFLWAVGTLNECIRYTSDWQRCRVLVTLIGYRNQREVDFCVMPVPNLLFLSDGPSQQSLCLGADTFHLRHKVLNSLSIPPPFLFRLFTLFLSLVWFSCSTSLNSLFFLLASLFLTYLTFKWKLIITYLNFTVHSLC